MRDTEAYIVDHVLSSCLGTTHEDHANKIARNEPGLTNAHRFSDYCDKCLGPIGDLGVYGVATDEEHRSDLVTTKIILAMVDELAQRTGVFERYQPHEIGLYLGSTTISLEHYLNAVKATLDNPQIDFKDYLNQYGQYGWLLAKIRQAFPVAGPSLCFMNSCASGNLAIAEAATAIRQGSMKACIAGGFDILTWVTVKGFEALQILSAEPSKPLTGTSIGINLAEGGGLLLLEAGTKVNPSGPARIVGHATSNDAYHMTQPFPGGKHLISTMEKLLQDSGLKADQIQYINAHGTGTSMNDAAELAAMAAVFSDKTFYESTKQWTGHTLAGSGALEMGLALIRCKQRGQSGYFINNSFGFGGTNITTAVEVSG